MTGLIKGPLQNWGSIPPKFFGLLTRSRIYEKKIGHHPEDCGDHVSIECRNKHKWLTYFKKTRSPILYLLHIFFLFNTFWRNIAFHALFLCALQIFQNLKRERKNPNVWKPIWWEVEKMEGRREKENRKVKRKKAWVTGQSIQKYVWDPQSTSFLRTPHSEGTQTIKEA